MMYDQSMQHILKSIPKAQLIYKDVDDNQSYFQCGKCGEVLTREQEETMRKKITGRFCNNQCFTRVEDLRIILHEDYYHIVNQLEKIKDYHWWHASYNDPSNIEFETNRDMHVGQYNAIYQIIDDKLPWFNTDYHVYDLIVKEHARIFPHVIPDYGVDWNQVEKELLKTEYDIFVYLNAWEGVGELSLIGKRNAFSMIDRFDNVIPEDRFEF